MNFCTDENPFFRFLTVNGRNASVGGLRNASVGGLRNASVGGLWNASWKACGMLPWKSLRKVCLYKSAEHFAESPAL